MNDYFTRVVASMRMVSLRNALSYRAPVVKAGLGGLLGLLLLGMHAAALAVTVSAGPTTCANVAGIGTQTWTNPTRGTAQDGSYATASVNDGQTTNYLQCTGYGFAIPAGAVINGITVTVWRFASATGCCTDAAMRMVKAGTIQAFDNSTATNYPTANIAEAHGGATDLWGTTWTAADINDPNFGAAFAAQKIVTAGGARTVSVDYIQITIDYIVPVAAVINTYYPATASVAAGATSITLGAATGAATPIASGDTVLIMQMQDATIDSTNSASYGTVSGGGAGLYEYAVATNSVGLGGGTLNLCNMINAYINANYVAGASGQKRFQVIRVPRYASYTLGAITAQAWNGSTGGVLALDVTGALTLNSQAVTVDGLGFRGGASRTLVGPGASGTNTDYRTLASVNNNASKGEGIAGTPQYVFTAPSTLTNTAVEGYPNGSQARGAPANGGGGGTDIDPPINDENPGGGGGGNGGAGGLGGIGWCGGFNAGTLPTYGCGLAGLVSASNPRGSTGGIGGSAVAGLGATRLTMGGGGGGGTTNNGTGVLAGGLSSSGAAGGGIIMLRAGSMTGTATFNANGSDGDSSVRNDGGGAAGAGGAVLISAGSGMGGVTINANGGTGGSTLVPPGSTATPHGPGGGGGGGYVITTGAPAAANVAAGPSGVSYNNGVLFGSYGSTAGSAGSLNSGLTATIIPGSALGATSCTSSVNHFFIDTGAATASTCTPKSVTISVLNALNNVVTSYAGTVNITTSPAHGDWSTVTAAGTLTAGAADSGAASYQFVAADNGVATLALTDQHADAALSVNVVDPLVPTSSTTSAAIAFSDNAFVITNDAVQVAGRPQAMSAAMWRKDPSTGNCSISPYYTGAKNLKAWLTRDISDPGGAAPKIGAVSLPSLAPGANNLALTFGAGSVNFNLTTTDVGKYALNLSDDSLSFASAAINGSSNTITTRPFALVVSAIKQGGANNPASSAPGGTVFAKAGTGFQATVGAYLWNSAADTNIAGGDGIPDAGATLAQITANGAAPSYTWQTTLSSAAPFTPAGGTLGSMSNGGQVGACPAGAPNCFANGIATPTNLNYSEVGSFTLNVSATNFLNSGVTVPALVFDNTGARNGVVGRFIPDHFNTYVLSLSGLPMLCPTGLTCPVSYNGFVYSGQPFSAQIVAQNAANATTQNYDGALGFSKAVTLTAWNAVGGATQNPNGGTFSSAGVASAAFSLGATSASVPAITQNYSLPNVTAPTNIYIRAQDTDAVTSLLAIPANSVEGGVSVANGRLRLFNNFGSEKASLGLNVQAQFWSGKSWVLSSTDSATAIPATSVALSNYRDSTGAPTGTWTTSASGPGTLALGQGTLVLSAPSPAGKTGCVDVAINLGTGTQDTSCLATHPAMTAPASSLAWLRGQNGTCAASTTYAADPSATACFGVYSLESTRTIHVRELF